MSAWEPGDVVEDLYEVLDVVRTGATGLVYRVRHRGWGIELAVKTPRRALSRQPEAVRNFHTEAESWVGLGLHPHVVGCVYVRTLDEVPRVFAEWADGGSLADAVRSRRVGELREVLDVAIQSAWGLEHAHAHGLVHQDVKPANVMLMRDRTVKVTDFGMARAWAAGERADGADPSVSLAGLTPAYCSPEQAAGTARLTSATDVWSWAVTVFELLAGGPPGPDGSLADALFAEFVRTHLVPSAMTGLLSRCFTRDATARPRRLGPLAEELVALYEAEYGRYPRRSPSAATLLADGLSNHALSMLDLDRPDTAEELWKQALRADPRHQQTRYNRSLYRWRTGRLTVADLVNELAAARSGQAADEYLLGLVYREQGDLERAGPLLRAAAERAPDDPDMVAAAADITRVAAPWSYLRHRPATEIIEHAGRAGTLRSEANELAAAGRFAEAAERVRAGRALPGHRRDAGLVALWRVLGPHGQRAGLLDAWPAGQIVPELNRSWALAFGGASPTVLARNGNDAEVWVFDLETGLLLHTLSLHTGHVGAMVLSEDGELAVSGGEDGRVIAWRPRQGRVVRLFDNPADRVYCVALSAAQQVALAGSADGVVTAFDLGSGRAIARGRGHGGAVATVAVGADHQLGISCGADGFVNVWDLRRAKLRHRFGTRIFTAGLSPDGRHVLTGHSDGTVRVWRTGDGKCRAVLTGHESGVVDVTMSADGRRVLSGSADGTVRLWEVTSGRCSQVLEGHSDSVLRVAATPDFGVAVSGSADHTVRLWNLANGTCLSTFDSHIDLVDGLALSPDGGLLLSGSPSGHLHTWALDWDYEFSGRAPKTARPAPVRAELRDEVAVAVPSRDDHRTGLAETLSRYGPRAGKALANTLELAAELDRIPSRTKDGHEFYVRQEARDRKPPNGARYTIRNAEGREVGEGREPGVAEMLALLLRPESELNRSEAFWASVLAGRLEDDLALLAETAPRLHQDGDLTAAEHTWRLILDVRAHLFGSAPVDTQTALVGLARVLVDQHREEEAAVFARTVFDQRTAELGPDHPATVDAAVTVAAMLAPRAAEKLLRETIPRLERRYGSHDERALAGWTELARTLRRRGKRRKADAILVTVLEKYRIRFEDDDPRVREIQELLGGMTMQSPEALLIGKVLLQDIGALFPVGLELRGADLEVVAALSDDQLGHRTTGPYTDERPPSELIEWAQLRAHMGSLAGRFPRFSIDASGPWARCLVELGGTAVRLIVVMPEEVTAKSLHATHLGTWQNSVRTSLMVSLDELYRRLTRCGDGEGREPMVELSLTYRPVKDYAKQAAETQPMAKEFVAPARPVLHLRWHETPANQRKKFLDELDKVERKGWPRRTVTEISGVELVLR